MVLFARLLRGINVHHSRLQVAQLVQLAVVDLACHRVAIGHRQLRVHRNVHLCAQAVAHPPRSYLSHVLHALYSGGNLAYLVGHGRVNPVQKAGEHHLARLPHDHQDRSGDQEPHDGVCERVVSHTPTAPTNTARLVHPSVLPW